MERIFSDLTTKQIRRGVHRSVRALEEAITDYLNAHNQSAKPFRWTATADVIFKKIEKLCSRISDSGHEDEADGHADEHQQRRAPTSRFSVVA